MSKEKDYSTHTYRYLTSPNITLNPFLILFLPFLYPLLTITYLFLSLKVPMSEKKPKPWKKTEDIPRRFDELLPEPEWVPVSDVIRTHREDEAKEEAKKFKIKPPVDSDSDSDSDSDTEANEGDSNRGKEWEAPEQKENEDERKYTETSKNTIDDTSMPPTVDDVTQSMVKWALNTEHYPKKVPKPQAPHQPHIKPQMNKPKPSHLVHDKSERPGGKEVASRASMEGRRHHTSPHTPDTQPNPTSPSKHKGHPSDTPRRMKTQQPITSKTKQPPYDEPSPDYDDDDDYNAFHSRYNEQYFRETAPDDYMYYYEEHGYENRGAVGPYEYEYRYDDLPPYNPHLVYTNPQGNPEYMYGEPQYMYGEGQYMYGEAAYMYDPQRSSYPYPQLNPYYGPQVPLVPPEEYPEDQEPSPYDVLY